MKRFTKGAGTPAKNPLPPTIWSYNDEVQDYPYDPEKAKQLLAEAGYPNGFTTDFWIQPVVRSSNPNPKRMAELIMADWAKVGVKTNPVTYEWADYQKRAKAGELTAGILVGLVIMVILITSYLHYWQVQMRVIPIWLVLKIQNLMHY